MTLVTCTACERHIRRTEQLCPFCGAAIAAQVMTAPERPVPTARLGRAALLAFAATYLGIGCSGKVLDEQRIGEGGASTGGFANGGTVASGGTGGMPLGIGGEMSTPIYGAPEYGAPPWSGGYPGSGGTTFAPPYGIAPFGGFPQAGGASGIAGAAGATGAGGAAGGGGSGAQGGGGAAQGGGGAGGAHANETMDGGADAEPDGH